MKIINAGFWKRIDLFKKVMGKRRESCRRRRGEREREEKS